MGTKIKINIDKKYSEEYNNISFKPGEKLDINKRNAQIRRDFQNSKKKLIQLQNLKEKLKNSIILRPEDLELDFNETNRRKPKKHKEKLGIKKQVKLSSKNLTNRKISNQNLANTNITKNEKDMIKDNSGKQTKRNSSEQEGKIKLQVTKPNFDIFRNSNISKNETELEVLKTASHELTTTQLPYVGTASDKNLILEKYRILTHKKMVYDSLDDDEFEDEINDFFILILNQILL